MTRQECNPAVSRSTYLLIKKAVRLFLLVGLSVPLAGNFYGPAPLNQRFDVPDQLEKILEKGELRVGTLEGPLSYFINSQGQPEGMEYELASAFASYLGVKLRMVVNATLAELHPPVGQDLSVDLIAANQICCPDRLTEYRAGPAYYHTSEQLIYRKGTAAPTSLAALSGLLGVFAGSSQAMMLEQLKRGEHPNLAFTLLETGHPEGLLRAVAEGRLDYTIADAHTVSAIQRVRPELTVAFDVSKARPVIWYFKRANEERLYHSLCDFFEEIAKNGLLTRLSEKYFGHITHFDYVDTVSFLNRIKTVLPQFRPFFENYGKEVGWELLAAISYQESHWNPKAISSTGVRGLMMLTLPTAKFVGANDRLDPEESIKGGAAYLSWLMQKLPASIPKDERVWFALSAYNMGFGHMLDARELTRQQLGNPDSWAEVKKRLPLLSDPRYYEKLAHGYARGTEAFHYVENVRRYFQSLRGVLQATSEGGSHHLPVH